MENSVFKTLLYLHCLLLHLTVMAQTTAFSVPSMAPASITKSLDKGNQCC
jgi:hypothetical protein